MIEPLFVGITVIFEFLFTGAIWAWPALVTGLVVWGVFKGRGHHSPALLAGIALAALFFVTAVGEVFIESEANEARWAKMTEDRNEVIKRAGEAVRAHD